MVLTFAIRNQTQMAAAVLSSSISSGLINARAGIDHILRFHTDQLQPEFLSVCSLDKYLPLCDNIHVPKSNTWSTSLSL